MGFPPKKPHIIGRTFVNPTLTPKPTTIPKKTKTKVEPIKKDSDKSEKEKNYSTS
jgi:hypothetical protein